MGVLCSPADSDQPRPMFTQRGGHSNTSTCGRCGTEGDQEGDIRIVDNDVVLLAVASFSNITPGELWIALGAGYSFQYIPVHQRFPP